MHCPACRLRAAPAVLLVTNWRLLGLHALPQILRLPGGDSCATCLPCPGCRLELHLCATLLRLLQWAPACSSLLAGNLVPPLVQRAVTALDRCNGREGSELLSTDAELLSALLKVIGHPAWSSIPCHKLKWQHAAGKGMKSPPRAMHVSSRCPTVALAIVACVLMLSNTTAKHLLKISGRVNAARPLAHHTPSNTGVPGSSMLPATAVVQNLIRVLQHRCHC